eukprot:CFRG0896T1
MKLGGNAKCNAFFRDHGCVTKDINAKYHSRAAILYREKLAKMVHDDECRGNAVMDGLHDTTVEIVEKDFFESEHQSAHASPNTQTPLSTPVLEHSKDSSNNLVGTALSNMTALSATLDEAVTSKGNTGKGPKKIGTLGGGRKKASGIGATKKGGLGVSKKSTVVNFDELEEEIKRKDEEKARYAADMANTGESTRRISDTTGGVNEELNGFSSRLQYDADVKKKDMSANQAAQVDRLGMGVSRVGGSKGSKGSGHRASSGMRVIDSAADQRSDRQADMLNRFDERGAGYRGGIGRDNDYGYGSAIDKQYNDGYDDLGRGGVDNNWDRTGNSLAPTGRGWSGGDSWNSPKIDREGVDNDGGYNLSYQPEREISPKPRQYDDIGREATSGYSSSGGYGNSPYRSNNYGNKPSNSSPSNYSSGLSAGGGGGSSQSASEKYGNAKAISSDMFNGSGGSNNAGAGEGDRLNQFAGAKSLSSAQYFGRDEKPAWQTQSDVGAAEIASRVSRAAAEGVADLSSKAADYWEDFKSKYAS